MKKKKGFTLIELLVVVAVIAILASVVLVNLRGARDKATDSRVVSAMGQVRTTAEIIYSSEGKYNTVCSSATALATTGDLKTLGEEIDANKGSAAIACHAENDDYCVGAPLKGGGFWCVDGKGVSKNVTGATNPCTSTKTCS